MLTSTSAPNARSFPSAAPAPQTLSELDERLAAGTPGVLVASAPGETTHQGGSGSIAEALIAHAARSVKGAGRNPVVARAHAGAPLWQEVASRLSVAQLPCNPSKCAEQIARAASARRAVIVARLPAAGSWDRAVAAELASLQVPPLVLFVSDGTDEASDLPGDRFAVDAALDDSEKRRWWGAIAEEAHALVASNDLAQLESWWAGVKRVSVVHAPETAGSEVLAPGKSLFAALALAGCPWQVAEIGLLEPLTEGALDALFAAGAVQLAGGWVTIAPGWEVRGVRAAAEAPAAAREWVAGALLSSTGSQPWAFARAAELLAHASADAKTIEAADRAQARALEVAEDPLVRREIVARWIVVVESLPAERRRELLVRTAERALAGGEPDEAARCLQVAGSLGSQDVRALMLLGRATAALGDLLAARVTLERARALAKSGGSDATELEALVAVEQADIAYLTGDVATSRRYAEEGALSSNPSTRLRGRNTLGKLLLAESKWEEADLHFVEDGMLAASIKDTSGELRARLNRGIARLSSGSLDEARTLFESVLADGERCGEARAAGYALTNLGHLASKRHEYDDALQHWERAIRLLHGVGDRLPAAITLTNLASLRLTIGLTEHAEQSLSFGRRTFGRGITSGIFAHFDIIAARIQLTRGRTAEARREIEATVRKASADLVLLGRAHRLAARIALEDGDLPRAASSISNARALPGNDENRAELALLDALYERAVGNEELEPARRALALARIAGEEELLRESHVLLVEVHRAAGNTASAQSHLEQAISLRDRIAERIPAEFRSSYFARPDVARLLRLQGQLAESSSGEVAASTRSTEEDTTLPLVTAPRSSGSVVSAAREIVGDDPTIRGLLVAIRKVARASSTVLIRGESGTGKELVAEALHRSSDRAGGPLVTVNCAALVETLLLSELFGHEKGAFTGAFARRRGRFELAEGGTLFLDEIGDISPRTQVALLRVLQERTFERVGGTTALRANVRIVCATHRDLRGMVDRGEFREDLYYRLRGITLEVPSLRSRLGDLPRLSEYLLGRIAVERNEAHKILDSEALVLLARHRWPGNVRELENTLRVASLFAESNVITACDLASNVDDLRALAGGAAMPGPATNEPSVITGRGGSALGERPSVIPASGTQSPLDAQDPTFSDIDTEALESDGPLPQIEANATSVAYAQVRQGSVSLSDMKRQIERDCIARALAETKGNITRAAAILGMKRPRLSQLVKQYGLAAVSSEGFG